MTSPSPSTCQTPMQWAQKQAAFDDTVNFFNPPLISDPGPSHPPHCVIHWRRPPYGLFHRRCPW